MLVTGHDAAVAAWAGQQLGVQFVQPLTAIGVVDKEGAIIGASVFNDYYRGGNLEWTCVGAGSLRAAMLREIARYCFIELEASRVTAKTRRSNKLVRRLLPKAGFSFEMTQKRYFGPTRDDDALVFVLFKENATKWLRSE